MRAPITSVKHYIQKSLTTVLAGQIENIVLVDAETPSATNAAQDVIVGSVVKAVYIEMWVRTGDTAPGTSLVTLVKTPDNQTPSFADMIALDAYTNKKNILYHTQGLINDQDADAIPFLRGWFKIPKGKQRFGVGDRLILVVTAQALDNIICGFATYKSYT